MIREKYIEPGLEIRADHKAKTSRSVKKQNRNEGNENGWRRSDVRDKLSKRLINVDICVNSRDTFRYPCTFIEKHDCTFPLAQFSSTSHNQR